MNPLSEISAERLSVRQHHRVRALTNSWRAPLALTPRSIGLFHR